MKFNRREWNVIYEAVKDYKKTCEACREKAKEQYEASTYDSLIKLSGDIIYKLQTEDI